MVELAAMVLGITEAVKKLHLIPNKYLPFVAILIGVGLNMYMNMSYQSDVVLVGLVTGLTVTGLYGVVDGYTKK